MTHQYGVIMPPVSSSLISSGAVSRNCSFRAFFSSLAMYGSFAILKLVSPNQNVMWKKSFLMFLFSLSVQRAALDCEWRNSKFHLLPSLFYQNSFHRHVEMVSFQHDHSRISLSLLLDEQPKSSLFCYLQFKRKGWEGGS